mgnify:CR=1 FL=1
MPAYLQAGRHHFVVRREGFVGGDEVQELLFWYFGDRFDPLTFPTLVDTLSHMGDRRVVKPALQRLGDFRSAAVRLQLMNGVCRALGAGDEFYRLLSLEDTRRTSAVIRLLRRTSTAMATSTSFMPSRTALTTPSTAATNGTPFLISIKSRIAKSTPLCPSYERLAQAKSLMPGPGSTST